MIGLIELVERVDPLPIRTVLFFESEVCNCSGRDLEVCQQNPEIRPSYCRLGTRRALPNYTAFDRYILDIPGQYETE